MAKAYLNIGSNIGDRHALIERAVALVEAAFGNHAERAPLEQSVPWGYESQNLFLNLGIAVEVGSLHPEQILQRLQQCERAISPSPHRNADGTYRDRLIDIDFIALDSLDYTYHSPTLILPHPHWRERPFVYRPLIYLGIL